MRVVTRRREVSNKSLEYHIMLFILQARIMRRRKRRVEKDRGVRLKIHSWQTMISGNKQLGLMNLVKLVLHLSLSVLMNT